MREIKIEPATLLDMAELAETVSASRAQWSIIRDTHAAGPSWTLRLGEDLVGIAGLAVIGPGQAEAWFHFRAEAAPVMRQVCRAIRLTMDASPYRAIVTLTTSEAGRRIARLTGFRLAGHSELGEVWAYGPLGRWSRETRDAGAAADIAGATGFAAGGA